MWFSYLKFFKLKTHEASSSKHALAKNIFAQRKEVWANILKLQTCHGGNNFTGLPPVMRNQGMSYL